MIGAIVLTLRDRATRARQIVWKQVAPRARPSDPLPRPRRRRGDEPMIGLAPYLAVAAILFTIGVFGIFVNRKNSSSS